MTQDYRALCAELSEALCGYTLSPDDCLLVNQARVALAEQPVRPTAKELRQIFDDQSGYIGDEQVMWSGDFVAAARAALARWGTSNLAQVRSSLGEVVEDDVDLYLEQ
jgi:hypothetical protein